MTTDPLAGPEVSTVRGSARVTASLIVASLAATILTWHTTIDATYHWFTIADYVRSGDDRVPVHPDRFHDILRGQVWRLATPALVHVKFLHLALNMVGLWVFASAIEARRGARFLAAQVAVLAICADMVQYLLVGPFFGGMSGVVYGLLAYIWMRHRRDPTEDIPLQRTYLAMMTVWLLYSLVFLPEAGNAAHLTGLGIGLAWGALPRRRAAAT